MARWLIRPTAVFLVVLLRTLCTGALGAYLRERQIPGLIDTMNMAIPHMIGDQLQGPEAAADLSNTVLSENFRSRYRVKLHCPVHSNDDWRLVQRTGLDILMSGNTKYSSACFKDAFDMYFNHLKKRQTDIWKQQAEQHAAKMTNMWDDFAKKVTQLKEKGDRLVGPHSQVSAAAAKHDQLELFQKMTNQEPGTSHAADTHSSPHEQSLAALRAKQQQNAQQRHQRFEEFKHQGSPTLPVPALRRAGGTHVGAQQIKPENNDKMSTADVPIEDQLEMMRHST